MYILASLTLSFRSVPGRKKDATFSKACVWVSRAFPTSIPHYFIRPCGCDDDVVVDIQNYRRLCVLARSAGHRLLRHTPALGVPVGRRGVTVQLDERGGSEGALPGTGCGSVSGKGGDPGRGRGFKHSWGQFRSGNAFICPVLGFHSYRRRIFPRCNTILPPLGFATRTLGQR